MNPPTIWQVLKLIVGAALAVALVRQCRKPTWWPGRMFAHIMNSSHGDVTAWGLQHVAFEPRSTILDVGCGGGKTLQRLLDLAPKGKVYGIDFAEASVAVATSINAASIAAGRADVRRGSVSSLPYPDSTFDVVTAIETLYYWPNPKADLEEVRRVLKPGGRVLIVAESYRGKRFGVADQLSMRLIGGRLLSTDGHRELLVAAGYIDVNVAEERGKGWLCAVGTRAS